jgi:hypothetical protein
VLALFLAIADIATAHASEATCPAQPCNPKHPANAYPTGKHAPLTATSYKGASAATYATQPPHPIVKEKAATIGPVSPGPTHASSSAPTSADQRSIIFVGGKSALNPQPIPPGHSFAASSTTLNSQLKATAPKPPPQPEPSSH